MGKKKKGGFFRVLFGLSTAGLSEIAYRAQDKKTEEANKANDQAQAQAEAEKKALEDQARGQMISGSEFSPNYARELMNMNSPGFGDPRIITNPGNPNIPIYDKFTVR